MTQASPTPDQPRADDPHDDGPGVAALRREAIGRALEAAAATRRYERSSWLLYVVAVVAVPLVVSGLFVRMGAGHFVLAGIAFVVVALAMMVLDQRAAARRDRRAAMAAQARAAYRAARSKAVQT